MELKKNQAAIIFEQTDDGKIIVSVEGRKRGGLVSEYCATIATKIVFDEDFRKNIIEIQDDGVVN